MQSEIPSIPGDIPLPMTHLDYPIDDAINTNSSYPIIEDVCHNLLCNTNAETRFQQGSNNKAVPK
eukprot:10844822-Ditylum_brightwellii.AAC.1